MFRLEIFPPQIFQPRFDFKNKNDLKDVILNEVES